MRRNGFDCSAYLIPLFGPCLFDQAALLRQRACLFLLRTAAEATPTPKIHSRSGRSTPAQILWNFDRAIPFAAADTSLATAQLLSS